MGYLLVCKIPQKVIDGFGLNFHKMLSMIQGTLCFNSAGDWNHHLDPGFFKEFFNIALISNIGGAGLWQRYALSECSFYPYILHPKFL